jgi:hypothetical protein
MRNTPLRPSCRDSAALGVCDVFGNFIKRRDILAHRVFIVAGLAKDFLPVWRADYQPDAQRMRTNIRRRFPDKARS